MTNKEYYDKLWQDSGLGRGCGPLLSIAALVIALLFLCGCRSTKTVTEEREIRDSIRYIDNVRDSLNIINIRNVIDSVQIRDSLVIVMDSAGKVLQTKEWHSEKTIKIERDSTAFYKAVAQQALLEMIKAQKDKKEVVVEKKLNKWQQLKVDWGGYAFLVLLLLLIFEIWRVIRYVLRVSSQRG